MPTGSRISSDGGDRLAPPEEYAHHRTGETNGDAHLKNLLLGHPAVLPVTAGRRELGPWARVRSAEFAGRRPKRVVVNVFGDPVGAFASDGAVTTTYLGERRSRTPRRG